MAKPPFRFLILAITLTLCVLAHHPSTAAAAACPTTKCQTIETDCTELCSNPLEIVPKGTCTDAKGNSHNEYLVVCAQCFGGECIP
jgi:hypothetical protein